MNDRHSDSGVLRELLRRGDPAAGERLPPVEVARLRERLAMEASTGEARSAWAGHLAWGAAAALLLAAVALRLSGTAPPPRAVPAGAAPVAVAANVESRQVQFVTSTGTRIVWVLSPNLNL